MSSYYERFGGLDYFFRTGNQKLDEEVALNSSIESSWYEIGGPDGAEVNAEQIAKVVLFTTWKALNHLNNAIRNANQISKAQPGTKEAIIDWATGKEIQSTRDRITRMQELDTQAGRIETAMFFSGRRTSYSQTLSQVSEEEYPQERQEIMRRVTACNAAVTLLMTQPQAFKGFNLR